VLVKVTVHPASQNFPILMMLFVNVGMMWLSVFPMGRFGKLGVAVAENCNSWPNAVLMDLASALVLILVTGATGMK
jgi:hypothetical protein